MHEKLCRFPEVGCPFLYLRCCNCGIWSSDYNSHFMLDYSVLNHLIQTGHFFFFSVVSAVKMWLRKEAADVNINICLSNHSWYHNCTFRFVSLSLWPLDSSSDDNNRGGPVRLKIPPASWAPGRLYQWHPVLWRRRRPSAPPQHQPLEFCL